MAVFKEWVLRLIEVASRADKKPKAWARTSVCLPGIKSGITAAEEAKLSLAAGIGLIALLVFSGI